MTRKACWLYDAGAKGAGEASNMAKYAAAEAAIHCVDAAIQTHGGNGVALEYGLSEMWWGARTMRIAPVSREMILNYVAEHSLGLPRSLPAATAEEKTMPMDDLARLDATAQAELVATARPRRPSWSTPRSSASRSSTRELNAVIHPLFDKARAAAASATCPTGRSAACRSCSRTSAATPRAIRSTRACAFLKELGWTEDDDTVPGRPLPRRRAS